MEKTRKAKSTHEVEMILSTRAFIFEAQQRRDEETRAVLGAFITGLLGPYNGPTLNWALLRNHTREEVERHIVENPIATDLEVLRFAMKQSLDDHIRGANADPELQPTVELVRVLHHNVQQSPLVTEAFASTSLRAVGW